MEHLYEVEVMFVLHFVYVVSSLHQGRVQSFNICCVQPNALVHPQIPTVTAQGAVALTQGHLS